MRQSGEDPNQVLFRNILLRMRDGQVTEEDWQHLMKQMPAQVQDLEQFCNALHLYPTVEAVAEHNVTKLHSTGQPIATVKATHMHHPTCQFLLWYSLIATEVPHFMTEQFLLPPSATPGLHQVPSVHVCNCH